MIIEVQRRGHIQRLTYEDFERRIRDGEIAADTAVRFELVTGDPFRPAGELELYQALADPEAVAFRENLTRRGLPIVTALLVGLQTRIYLWSWAPGATRWLQDHMTSWTPTVLEEGKVWRLLTYGVLHVDFTHLLSNMLFLAYAGYHLERALGRLPLLLLYFGSVATGGLLSMAMSPELPTLGASGGGFGLLAAAVIFGWKHWESIPQASRKYFGFAILPYPMISLLTSIQAANVDNWCHLGGLIGGATLATLLEPEVYAASARRNRAVAAGALAVFLATSATLALAGPRLLPLTEERHPGLIAARPVYWRSGIGFTGDAGWVSPTGKAWMILSEDALAHPTTADAEVDALVARMADRARDVVVVDRGPAEVPGAEARWLVAELSLEGVPHQARALVLARGVYATRILLLTTGSATARLAPLATRLFAQVRLDDPPELSAAREEVAKNPRSWGPNVTLGLALSQVGDVEGALQAFATARGLAPQEPAVISGELRVLTDHRRPEAAARAREALALVTLEPRVTVAAAEALKAAGQEAEAVAVLDEAWDALPGDRTLKATRRAWGLSTDLRIVGSQPR